MHAEIDTAWRELADRGDGPALAAVFAGGHATPSRTVLADGKLRITKADPEWLPHAGWRGDGTVPAISAVPPELEPGSTALRQVPERHLAMAGTPAVTDLLRACDCAAPQPPLRHQPVRPWLGVAVDNVVPAGDPVTVVAEVLGGPADEAMRMWVRVTGAGRTGSFRCERAGHQWRPSFPANGPARTRLRYRLRRGPAPASCAAGTCSRWWRFHSGPWICVHAGIIGNRCRIAVAA